jgi:saccharopine dehydrogenase-like NADP-dependent oxidoreductase
MKRILVLGAGLSSGYLIDYLANLCQKNTWSMTVADNNYEAVKAKTSKYASFLTPKRFELEHESDAEVLFRNHDVIISLMPAFLQPKVATYCLKYRKHLFTASYCTPEIKSMDGRAKAYNLLFMNELGLDPGLDHLSAMKMIDKIHAEGGKIHTFYSYAGALISPESDNNPWHYKFTWNPRNVVLAGQGVPVKYLENGKYRYIPYHHIFKQLTKIHIEGFGEFEGYANRDSMIYKDIYKLEQIKTLLRGTLRRQGFASGWDILVELGLTNNDFIIENANKMTYKDLVESFLMPDNQLTIQERVKKHVGKNISDEDLNRIEWLGLFSDNKIKLEKGTPAEILLDLLSRKWQLDAQDKDMIVMQHRFLYHKEGKEFEAIAELTVIGEAFPHTAIAKTVGLPLAIGTKLLLQGNLTHLKGVHFPTDRAIYEPILNELKDYNVIFNEKITQIS